MTAAPCSGGGANNRARRLIPLLLAVAWVVSACAPPAQFGGRGSAAQASEEFLKALVAGRVEYVWERLTPATRDEVYGNDREALAREVRTADWSRFRWTIGPITDYEISWGVHVEISPEAVPGFLVDRGLVAPFGDEGIVLLVQFTDEMQYVVAGQGLDTDMR